MQNYIGSLLSNIAYLDLNSKNFSNGKLTIDGAEKANLNTSDMLFFNQYFTMKEQSPESDLFTGSVIINDKDLILGDSTVMKKDTVSIAYRGTEETADWLTDIGLAYDSAVSLYKDLDLLTVKLKDGNIDFENIDMDDLLLRINNFGSNSSLSLIAGQRQAALNYFNMVQNKYDSNNINLYGHSLGGYLANYVTVMGQNNQNINETITYNAPGFSTTQIIVIQIANLINQFKEYSNSEQISVELQNSLNKIISSIDSKFNINSLDKLNSIYSTTGLEFTSSNELGMAHPELRYPLYTDSSLNNHSIVGLREILCVYDSLSCFMPGGSTLKNYEYITKIIEGFSKHLGFNSSFKAGEEILNQISILMGIPSTTGLDILTYVNSLSNINQYEFKRTDEFSALDLSSGGNEILYSLINYIPFTITGANQIIDDKYNPEKYTKENIEARFQLFNEIMSLKGNDIDTVSSSINNFQDYKIFFNNKTQADFLYIDTVNKLMYTNDLNILVDGNEAILNKNLKTTYFKDNGSLIVNTSNNIIYDHYGSDHITLNKGETELNLSYGNDTINIDVAAGATLKNVTIKDGGVGDLFIFNGGAGADFIQGTQYNDKIIGGAGDDHLFAGAGNDTIDGGLGSDMIFGEDGDDILIGGDGNDMLMGGAGSNSLSGGDGDDTLNAYNTLDEYHDIRGDVLSGGTGTNSLFGTGYGDTYIYGGGIDTIRESDKHYGVNYIDKLKFASNIQTSQVSLYNILNNLVIAINGLDKIFVIDYYNNNYSYLDEIHFINPITGYSLIWDTNYILQHTVNTADNKVIIGTSDAETINGTEADNYIEGRDGNDIINGGDGNDTIYGGNGDDVIHGNNGNDVLYGNEGNDQLYGDAGNDTIYGDEGNDLIDGGIGVDTLYGGNGNDNIIGGSLVATEVDIIYGGDGNDIINQSQSFTGDIVWGGLGDDLIYGATGGDSYHYSFGDGHDKIIENNNSSSYTDQLFLHGINPDDVKIYRKFPDFNDLIIDINNGYGTIVIVNYYQNTLSTNYLDKITFDNGTQWSSDAIKLQARNYYGTNNADTLILNNGLPNIIHSGDGIDVITNETVDNTINAGNGDDKIYNNGKNVTIHGDDGKDSIILNNKAGAAGTGTIYGDSGDDTISFNSTNGASNYTIIGGLDNDKIYMSNGTETIKYSMGDGNDIIYISGNNLNTQRDKLIFENISLAMINNSTLRLENKGRDVVFIFDEKNSITLSNYFLSTAYLNNLYSFEFSDGSLSNMQLKNMITQISKADSTNVFYDTVWDDKIIGSNNVDIITVINGGTDEIFGEGGDDIITGNSANQTIHGGAGVDRINSGNGFDTIYGDDGDDFISSVNDSLNGATQNDSMIGGKGNDTIYLFAGSSTIYYDLGDGQDTILLGSDSVTDIDRIIFGNGITPENVKLKLLNKKDVLFSFTDGGSILINDYFVSRTNLQKIDFFKFSNGTEWTAQDIVARLGTIEGTNGQDVIYDTVWDDTINAYEGKDYIYSTSGADIINAGGGDDYISLQGSNGALVDAGSGDDYIYVTTKNNTIKGGSGDDEYWIDGDNTTLIMTSANNGVDYITTPNLYGTLNIKIDANMSDMYFSGIKSLSSGLATFYWNSNNGFKISLSSIVSKKVNFIFNDGQTQNLADIVNKMQGDEYSNYLDLRPDLPHIKAMYGMAGNDTLRTKGGATYLDGGEDDDLLINTSYNPVRLEGGSGNDQFQTQFGATITDVSGYDKVYFSASGVSYSSLKLTHSGSYIVITNMKDNKTLNISNSIEEIIFNNAFPGDTVQPIARLVGNEINQLIEYMAQLESDDLADMAKSEDPEIVKSYNEITKNLQNNISNLWGI